MQNLMPIADTHCDFLYHMAFSDRSIYAPPEKDNHITKDGLLNGGYVLQVFAIWVDALRKSFYADAVKMADSFNKLIETTPEIVHVKDPSDFQKINPGENFGAILSVEGLGEATEGELDRIKEFYDRGARMMSFTWNNENEFAYGAWCDKDLGLKEKGFKALEILNELNVAVDVSHLNIGGFWNVVERSKSPILASHSNVHSLYSSKRNLFDDQIKAIIDKNGYIGVSYYPPFLGKHFVSVKHVVKNIEYIASLGGIDHVGLGSDFDGMQKTPTGLSGSQEVQNIPEELAKLNYSEEQIKKICALNFIDYIVNFL